MVHERLEWGAAARCVRSWPPRQVSVCSSFPEAVSLVRPRDLWPAEIRLSAILKRPH